MGYTPRKDIVPVEMEVLWDGDGVPVEDWMEVPDGGTPPSGTGLHLDRLYRGRYASCGFPQDLLVFINL